MFLCNKCGDAAENRGESKPLREYYPKPKEIVFERRHCGRCGKKTTCYLYPTVTVKNESEEGKDK